MKKLFLAAMLAAVVVSCAQPATQTSSEIPARSVEWLSALNAGDIETLATMYAENCRVLPPNAEMVSGRSGAQQVFGAMNEAGLTGGLETVEAFAAGDLAYHLGKYTIFAPDGSAADRGKFIEIWRQVSGEWLISSDIWNSDMPATPAGSTVIYTHEVEDPEVWLAAWRGPESRHGLFAQSGAPSVRVFQSPGEPNLTGLLVQATNLEALQAMIASPEGLAAAAEDTVRGDTVKMLLEVE
jgi:ketosteroid isomerase-like protein